MREQPHPRGGGGEQEKQGNQQAAEKGSRETVGQAASSWNWYFQMCTEQNPTILI